MDAQTLAAFRASGETDLAKYLAKQATADVPPGVPAGSYAGSANFQGSTNAERGLPPTTPTGNAFLGRLHSGLSKITGIPSLITSLGDQVRNTLGLGQPVPPANSFVAGKSNEAALDALQARSNALTAANSAPVLTVGEQARAGNAPRFDSEGYPLNKQGTRATVGDQAEATATAAKDAKDAEKKAAADAAAVKRAAATQIEIEKQKAAALAAAK